MVMTPAANDFRRPKIPFHSTARKYYQFVKVQRLQKICMTIDKDV